MSSSELFDYYAKPLVTSIDFFPPEEVLNAMLGDQEEHPSSSQGNNMDKAWEHCSSRAVFFHIKAIIQKVSALIEDPQDVFSFEEFLNTIITSLHENISRGDTPFIWWTTKSRLNSHLGCMKRIDITNAVPTNARGESRAGTTSLPSNRNSRGLVQLPTRPVQLPSLFRASDFRFDDGDLPADDNSCFKKFLGDSTYTLLDILCIRVILCKAPGYMRDLGSNENRKKHCIFTKTGLKYLGQVMEMTIMDEFRLSWLFTVEEAVANKTKTLVKQEKGMLPNFFMASAGTSTRTLSELDKTTERWKVIIKKAVEPLGLDVWDSFASEMMSQNYENLNFHVQNLSCIFHDPGAEQENALAGLTHDPKASWRAAVDLYTTEGYICPAFIKKLFEIRKEYVYLAKQILTFDDPASSGEYLNKMVKLFKTFYPAKKQEDLEDDKLVLMLTKWLKKKSQKSKRNKRQRRDSTDAGEEEED